MATKEELDRILPWTPEPIVEFFQLSQRRFLYGEQLLELIREARHAFLAECPRASMIVAGEAFLRVIYELIAAGARTGCEASIHRGSRKGTFSISPNMDPNLFFQLEDELTFYQAIKLLSEVKQFSGWQDAAYAVKAIRNQAAHGNLPIITDWDPDEPRSDKSFWFDKDFQFPEAYAVIYDNANKRVLNFDLRRHNCGSLKVLSWQMRLAAIQYLTVIETIAKLNGKHPEVGA